MSTSRQNLDERASKILAEYNKLQQEYEAFREQRKALLDELKSRIAHTAKLRCYMRDNKKEKFKRTYGATQIGIPRQGYTPADLSIHLGSHFSIFNIPSIPTSHLVKEDWDIIQKSQDCFSFIEPNGKEYLFEFSPMREMKFSFRATPFSRDLYDYAGISKELGEYGNLHYNKIDIAKAFEKKDCVIVVANDFQEAYTKAKKKGLSLKGLTSLVKIEHSNGDIQYRRTWEYNMDLKGNPFPIELFGLGKGSLKLGYIHDKESERYERRLELIEKVYENIQYAEALAKKFNIKVSRLISEIQEGKIDVVFGYMQGWLQILRFPNENFRESQAYLAYQKWLES